MPPTRPNVLFLPIDDLRPQLGCYGRRRMITPHIDALASRGVLFRRAYCQVPVCGASRASLLSGVRPARDRFVNYKTRLDLDLPGARTLPQHFREHGYLTVSDGKVFHHRDDAEDRSWSAEPWHPHMRGNWRNYLLEENRRIAEADRHRAGPPFECADVADNAYFDGQIADRAVEDLHRLAREDVPFFLAAGFLKPHLPFNAPKRYWDLYDRDEVDLADNPYPPHDAPQIALHNFGELRGYFRIPSEGALDEGTSRTLVHGYYAATSYIDAQVGRMLDELDALGLRESTVVVLWGDHGWQLGEHGLWCKHCNFETSLNAPLIVSGPGCAAGEICEGLVEFLDIFPTLCRLAGLSVPDGAEGESLSPLLERPDRPGKSEALCRFGMGDSIRTERYLYTQFTRDDGSLHARMLYDHEQDPDENRNVAERPELAATVAELSERLRGG